MDGHDWVRDILCESDDAPEDELRVMLARSAAANGWDEPGMDGYDRYDEERACRR